ncbi:ATP-grasp domain-containing protein [Streptomyces hygroscopicus subsp. hygroscopicus]|uniref:ATP-grasp domain-containing protein n=1 Tax=Streptomyces hygroscopicus TaxID=1912 RepID=UPI001C658A90|nr:ATP-grasp domain-containing protein [Streptomyces hygroscopicus]MBW8090883.1 ATP-grasp domain-containing protein [Streptomyces hygroscopicus subsp. hygroscopicus]
MRKSVLLVNGGKREATRLLKEEFPVDLIVLTEPRFAHLYDETTEVVLVDDVEDLQTARDAVLTALSGRDVDHVVSPTERGQVVAAFLRAYFGTPGASFEVAHAFTNKYSMKLKLRRSGLPVASGILLTAPEKLLEKQAELTWPVVLKPVVGSGSAYTHRIDSADDLRRFLDSPEGAALRACGHAVLAEEFVAMEGEYHCDGVVSGGEVEFAVPSRYLQPLLGRLDQISGSVTLPEDDPDREEILRLHVLAVKALGLEGGVTHMELFKTERGFIVGEIACRPGGAGVVDHVRRHCGVDLWREFIRTSLGEAARIVPRPARGITAHVHLPPAPGRVVDVTPAEEFMAIPDVKEVDMRVCAGDVIGPEVRSSSTVGLIYLETPDLAVLDSRVKEIAEVYRLSVEPV